MNTWGEAIRLSIFGESHGPAVGIVIDGIPAGEEIDLARVAGEMRRRAPGRNALSTARSEADEAEILSGLLDDKTNGFPLAALIRNRDARSRDYDGRLRPGHADWTALLKHGGQADMRGGGHFSGRLTAPLVFAGAVAKQLLARRGVAVHGRVLRIGGIADETAFPSESVFAELGGQELAVADAQKGDAMREAIAAARADGDSLGGVIEIAAFHVPGGLGEPFFDSIESKAASLLFSIPAVKGVEFGDGFALADMRGSGANDPLRLRDGAISADSNHNGGILGGITTGQPVVARIAVKPTPSIAKPQRSVDAAAMRETTLETKGRHDPCIVPRAVPVAEAALALAILDALAKGGGLR